MKIPDYLDSFEVPPEYTLVGIFERKEYSLCITMESVYYVNVIGI